MQIHRGRLKLGSLTNSDSREAEICDPGTEHELGTWLSGAETTRDEHGTSKSVGAEKL